MKTKIILILISIISFIGTSFGAWSWKYYQVYTSKWDTNKTTIYNGILNNNLNSTYYIEKGDITNIDSENLFERKEGDIMYIVRENGEFNVLSGFDVTQIYNYYGGKAGFTAIYNGRNFAYYIYINFRTNSIIDVNLDEENNILYKDITVAGVTKRIKIADFSNRFNLLSKDLNGTYKIKITNGYTNRLTAISKLSYTLLYYTRYKKDTTGPESGSFNIYYSGTNYPVTNTNTWVNKPVYVKISCIDNPDSNPNRNSGCENDIYNIDINTQIAEDTNGLYYTMYDKVNNRGNGYLDIHIAIDNKKPIIVNNRITLKGKNDITEDKEYYLNKNSSEYTILADKYKLSFSVKDPGDDCETNGCLGVSGIKSIKVTLDGISQLNKSYTEYNPNKERIEVDEKNISLDINLSEIGNTGNRDRELNLIFEDFAGNIYSKTWTLHVKPNKPIPENFTISCLHGCPLSFANNANTDYYKYGIYIKDRWGNIVRKKIKDIQTTNKSYIDKNTYDGNLSDDGNAVKIYNQMLGTGLLSIRLKSIVPGDFYKEFKIKIKAFDEKYNDLSNDWYFTRDFGIAKFKYPITGGQVTIYDTSGNMVELSGLARDTYYTAKIPIYTNGFSNNNYSYTIGDITVNTFKALPEDIYETIEIKNISGNQKNNGSTPPSYLTFDFKYNYKAGGVINKTISFKFRPSIKVTSSGDTGMYTLYHTGIANVKENGWLYIGTGEDMRFRFSVIGLKYTKGQTYAIGQGKKQFNIESYNIKSKIRKNAYKYINSMKKDKINNGVLILEGDTKISDISDISNVKTLIVHNGNLIIDNDINKRIDIAVVTDGTNYDIANITNNDIESSNNYLSEGNIKITNNVRYINGLLYTDRSLLSTDQNGKIITSDNPSKSSLLKKQLLFFGTIVSKNTVGGSIMGTDNKYTLPGGKKTSNLKLASIFDIAFLRLGYEGYDSSPNNKYNAGKDDYVIVRYNPAIKQTPGVLLK